MQLDKISSVLRMFRRKSNRTSDEKVFQSTEVMKGLTEDMNLFRCDQTEQNRGLGADDVVNARLE